MPLAVGGEVLLGLPRAAHAACRGPQDARAGERAGQEGASGGAGHQQAQDGMQPAKGASGNQYNITIYDSYIINVIIYVYIYIC